VPGFVCWLYCSLIGKHYEQAYNEIAKNVFKIVPMKSPEAEDDFVNLPPSECLSLVWELTKEAFSLSGDCDVELRLQGNVVTIIKQ